MPDCIPTIPQQPDDAYYPVSKLYVVPTFDRAGYKAAFGEDAPTYDGTRQTKNWFDSTAIQAAGSENALVSYTVIAKDASGNVIPKQISMPAKEAATVNLYGVHSYPTYVVAPTGAVGSSIPGINTPVNPVNLSMQADAIALAQSFGLNAMAVSEQAMPIIYPAAELRRMWMIQYKGLPLNAGLLLAERNANGANAPGHWNLDGAEPNWISATAASMAPQNPAWDVPCRPLASNEALSANLFGFMIYRTDRQSVFNPVVAPAVVPVVPVTPAVPVAPVTPVAAPAAASNGSAASAQDSFLNRLEQALMSALRVALAQALIQK